MHEIKEIARRHLVAAGPSGITLRAIARDMGMTPPALYRYITSLEDLVRVLIADYYDELTTVLERTRDTVPEQDTVGRLLAMVRAFRAWALGNPAEFALIFTTPLPASEMSRLDTTRTYEAGRRFGAVFFELAAELWRRHEFPVPAEDDLPPALREQLRGYADYMSGELPLGVMQVCVSCWSRLYGLVCLEVFGQLRFLGTDGGPVFEQELNDIAERLGAPYRARENM